MVLEVADEPLPVGWEVVMSRSKNMPYYYHAKSQKVYWVDDELPSGWAHQFDQEGRVFYFHIKNKQDTTSYEKPALRKRDANESPSPPPPLATAASSSSSSSYGHHRGRGNSDEEETHRRYEPPSRATYGEEDHALPPPPKKGNSLMDLLSPAPPTGDDDGDQYEPAVAVAVEPATSRPPPSHSMSISHLVSGGASSSSYGTASGTGTKRAFDQITKDFDPNAAADFYNKLKRNATADRAESLLFHMRSMNNWVKSILINEYSKRDDHVLDLACGKGGDLMKWAKRGILKYVGADIAQKSLEDAVDRFVSNVQHRDLEVQFVQGDLGKVSLLEDQLHCWTRERGWHDAVPLPSNSQGFHVVSMQFSFHYMFGDEQRAQQFFRTLHSVLRDGGIFIATTVDPNKVLHKYYQSLQSNQDSTTSGSNTSGCNTSKPDVRILDEQKREVCTIRFDESIKHALAGYDADPQGRFGLRYNFTLRDTTDDEEESGGGSNAVDLPEYLVPDDLLDRLLKENGFELLLKQNFHPFITKNLDKNRSLLDKMHVLNYAGTLSDAEWEIAGLYQVLAFKKTY